MTDASSTSAAKAGLGLTVLDRLPIESRPLAIAPHSPLTLREASRGALGEEH